MLAMSTDGTTLINADRLDVVEKDDYFVIVASNKELKATEISKHFRTEQEAIDALEKFAEQAAFGMLFENFKQGCQNITENFKKSLI